MGRPAAWVYFSHNWYKGAEFPADTAGWVRSAGAVPFIRLMLRGPDDTNQFPTGDVAAGAYDAQLRAWAEGAKAFGGPLLVEYGTEVNGDWFPWNGRHNGGGRTDGFGDPRTPDGPERFVAAYRHVVSVVRRAGANNITWVFHVGSRDEPTADWNRLERYYPGDDVVDWVGVSVYGPQEPSDDKAPSFRALMDACYPRLARLAPHKPMVVLEFGCTAGNPRVRPEEWAGAALDDLLGGRWPNVIGFAWWNEAWENDDDPANNTTMRVQDIPALARTFRRKFASVGDHLLTRARLTPAAQPRG